MITGPQKAIRVIGFDDAPFDRSDEEVNITGAVCSNTRFEGMLWGSVRRDGLDATEVLVAMLGRSKYHRQVHALLLDGIAFGGLNIVDLPLLSEGLDLPCIAVMRREPDLEAMIAVIERLPKADQRLHMLERAGEIFHAAPFVYQTAGIDADEAASLLARVTDVGHVPEALRLAHLIGAAVKTGSSGRRA